MYIVAEGVFDVVVKRADGSSVCHQGAGSVFGSFLGARTESPRAGQCAATVRARSGGCLWLLEKRAWEQALRAPAESKSIGLVGGVMLLINNLAGPTIVSMPALAQESGWFSLFLVQAVVAGFSSLCGLMLIEAMRCIPGNHRFEQTIEFTNLASFYLPHELYVGTMICYHINSILNLMSLIIQSGQVMDYIMLNVYGCAPGLELGFRAAYVTGCRVEGGRPSATRLPCWAIRHHPLTGLTPATAASWRKYLSQLRSRMVLAWLLFLLQPTLPYNIKPRVQKFLQVSSGWLYGYGSFVFVYFAAIIYTYSQRHSAYGTMLFVLAATFAVPFLESRPSANAWLRKFLVYNATVPVYLCAGLCKIRYLGLKAILSGSWITHGVMDRTHGYSCIPWANKWLVSQPAVLGFPEPWTCMFLSYFTMFFEILAPVGCIALTQPGKTPSFVWKLWLLYLVFCIEFHVQVFFQFGPNWAEQTILVLFACDPLKPLQPLFGKLGGKNSELPQVFVDAEHLGPRVASLGDRLRAVLGFGMLLGWLFVQLWSDVCGTQTDSVTPFGDRLVLSSSMLAVALVCAPFAVKNLDDNVVLQYLAVIGLMVMAVIWIALLLSEPAFPRHTLPTVTTSQSSLIGTVLFNFAFSSALPSWVNEKKADVPVGVTFWTTMSFVVVLYSIVGIIGGMAYAPFYDTNENLFSKLNAGGSRLGQATVAAYPMLQNVTSIPVLAILIRCNLIQGGLHPTGATFLAVGLPWLMSIPFYTGSGFDTIAEVGGLATSSVINFMLPLIMYVVAVGRKKEREELLNQTVLEGKKTPYRCCAATEKRCADVQEIYRAQHVYDPIADPPSWRSHDVSGLEVSVPAPQKLLFTISQVLPLSYSLIAVAPRSQSGSQELTDEYQSMFEGTGGHSAPTSSWMKTVAEPSCAGKGLAYSPAHCLMQQLRDFWKEGHLCDVVLKSVDGIQHQAHRNVLSAASAAFKALLCAPFRELEQIQQGKPVEMAASSGVVSAFLDYLYGGEPEVTSLDAVEVLRLAGAYGLPLLAASVESDLRASLTSQLALQLLPETLVLGLHELQQACEEQIACDFQQCALQEDFQKLSAKQFQRILQREDLNVSREELVVEALFRWSKSSQDKKRDMVLLLAHVDFPSLSTSNLDLLRHAAQSLGSWGLHLECDIKEAMAVHKNRTASDEAPRHRSKRRCLARWSEGLGADKERNLDESRVTPHLNGCGWRLVWHRGTFLLVDHLPGEASPSVPWPFRLEFRVVACKPGDKSFQIVAGQGARVNGVNPLILGCIGHAVSPAGEVFLISPDDQTGAQLLSFQDGVGKVLLRGMERPGRLCGSPNGVLYIVDELGEKVRKLEGSAWTTLLSTGQLPENQQEKFESIFASGQETLYITQGARILRLLAGASVPTVVADCGQLQKISGFFVTEDERIFICGQDNKVWMAQAGEPSWSVVLQLPNGNECALFDVLVQGQVLYVILACESERGNRVSAAVYQYALPPRLELEALSSS
eukprot:symbB.v1.2.003728.t2/scaffold176.1/size287750/10